MTSAEKLEALAHMTGSRGWGELLVPLLEERYKLCLFNWMHTPNQTEANIHKNSGLASAYDFLLHGIDEWMDELRVAIENENIDRDGDPEHRAPV